MMSTELAYLLEHADLIEANFHVKKLQMILSKSNVTYKSNYRKGYLVNLVCGIYGDGSTVIGGTVNSLRTQALTVLKQMPKSCTNILYAVNIYEQAKLEYENRATFKSDYPWLIQVNDKTFRIEHWYAQPAVIDNEPIGMIIDPHHIFVTNRVHCCSYGMAGMNIHRKAWVKVAEQEHTEDPADRTGLSLELVVELRDRQRNAFTATTFSEKFEEALIKNGDFTEAKWCRLLRNWYAANDEAGVALEDRIQWMLDIRSYLLDFYHPGTFPPSGKYVAGLPIAQFEGIISNVDRRLQLYALTSKGCYNNRAVSSLDSETLFGSFQVRAHNKHMLLFMVGLSRVAFFRYFIISIPFPLSAPWPQVT